MDISKCVELGGIKVEKAVFENSGVETVLLPKTMEKIPEHMFAKCKNLKTF